MAIEHASIQVARKPWNVADLHPWSSIDGSGGAVGELWFQRTGDSASDPSLLLKLLFTSEPLSIQGRHRNLLATFEARAEEMEQVAAHGRFSKDQRQLIGAYFLNQYSFEASAVFNPSIVRHPDQSDAPTGGLRFILSLRAIGEGHMCHH